MVVSIANHPFMILYISLFTVSCSFESGDCGFIKDPNLPLKWIRISGKTETSDTGPDYDHTKFSSEGMLYIEQIYYEFSK